MILDHRLFKDVAAFSSQQLDYVVPAGRSVFLKEVGASCPVVTPDVEVRIIWDPTGANEVIFFSGANASQTCLRVLEGDGVKALRIILENNSAITEAIGGYAVGEI
jgi:hypothetical protein